MNSIPENDISIKIQTFTESQIEYDKIWNVIVLNDPVNLMSYVTMIFQKVFGYNSDLARKLMLEVHQQGRALVWSGDFEKAENYVYQLQQWQLNVSLEEHVNH